MEDVTQEDVSKKSAMNGVQVRWLQHLVSDQGAADQALNVGVTRGRAIGNSLQQQPLKVCCGGFRAVATLENGGTAIDIL